MFVVFFPYIVSLTALTSALLAVAVGIPACILCLQSLKLLLPTLFCLLYTLREVVTEAQLVKEDACRDLIAVKCNFQLA